MNLEFKIRIQNYVPAARSARARPPSLVQLQLEVEADVEVQLDGFEAVLNFTQEALVNEQKILVL